MRKPLLALLLLGLIGTAAELLLLGHDEDVWQLVPLVLLGAALIASVWEAAAPSRASRGAFRPVMLLLVICGPLGLWLHYRGNAAFELESEPGLSGLTLFREAMTGGIPALAPGAMTLFGLLGLIYSARSAGSRGEESSEPNARHLASDESPDRSTHSATRSRPTL